MPSPPYHFYPIQLYMGTMTVETWLSRWDPLAVILIGVGVALFAADDIAIIPDPTPTLISIGVPNLVAPGIIAALALGVLLSGWYRQARSAGSDDGTEDDTDWVDPWPADASTAKKAVGALGFCFFAFVFVVAFLPADIVIALGTIIYWNLPVPLERAMFISHASLAGVLSLTATYLLVQWAKAEHDRLAESSFTSNRAHE